MDKSYINGEKVRVIVNFSDEMTKHDGIFIFFDKYTLALCSNDILDEGKNLLHGEILIPAGEYECKVFRENKWEINYIYQTIASIDMVYNNCLENVNLPYKIEGHFKVRVDSNMILKIKAKQENDEFRISVYNNKEEIGKEIGYITSDEKSVLRWIKAFWLQQSILFIILSLAFILISYILFKPSFWIMALLGLGFLIVLAVIFSKFSKKFKNLKEDISKYI